MNEEEFKEFVQKRPDLSKFCHYVSGSHKQRGYYRRIPKTYYNMQARPLPQLRAQLALAENASSLYKKNLKGFKEGIPVIAFENAKALKGKTFKAPKWEEAIRKLSEVLKEIGVIAKKT